MRKVRTRGRVCALAIAVAMVALLVGPIAPAGAVVPESGEGWIEGTIYEPGGSEVCTDTVDVHVFELVEGEWVGIDRLSTDTGAYSFDGIEVGTYRVGFFPDTDDYADEYYGESPTILGAEDVSVEDQQTTTGIDVELDEPVAIEGTVTGTGTGYSDDPVSGVVVDVAIYTQKSTLAPVAISTMPGVQAAWYSVAETTTDGFGDYVVEGLHPDGAYAVYVAPSGDLSPSIPMPDWATEVYDDMPAYAYGGGYYYEDEYKGVWDLVSFSGGVTETCDAALTEPGAVSGTVTDTNGNVITDVKAKLFYNAGGDKGWRMVDYQWVSASGEYGWDDLKAGEYKVWVYDYTKNWQATYTEHFTVTGGDSYQRPVVMELTPTEYVPVEGADRYATAVEASKQSFDPGEACTVVIATGAEWPDALGGAALAGAKHGPVLLTRPTDLPAAVAEEIVRLGVQDVVIVGGTGAVGTDVEQALANIVGAENVARIAGADRYETAAEIAMAVKAAYDENGHWFSGEVLVASGLNFPDALAAAPIAAKKKMPLLLVQQDAVPPATANAVMELEARNVLLLGGFGAVSEKVGADLLAYESVEELTRVGGADRYETAKLVAEHAVDNYYMHWDGIALATGMNYPDALAGGVLQGLDGGVMLLTPGEVLSGYTRTAFEENVTLIHEVRYLGGTGAISQAVRDEVAAILH
jgi:putative cell wall-binding protein